MAGSLHCNEYLWQRSCEFKNASGVALKNKYNICQLKHYIQGAIDKWRICKFLKSCTRRNCLDDFALRRATIGEFFPGHKCETYVSIKPTRRKWARIIDGKSSALLPKIYIDTSKPLGNPYNEKTIVSTRKLTSIFRKSSGIASQLSDCISDKKWRSSWLILIPGKHS